MTQYREGDTVEFEYHGLKGSGTVLVGEFSSPYVPINGWNHYLREVKVTKHTPKPEPVPAPRTPLYPHALTLDDVKAGVEYIRVNIYDGPSIHGKFLGTPFTPTQRYHEHFGINGGAWVYEDYAFDKKESIASLHDMGILPRDSCKFNEQNFTVANTAESLLELAKWYSKQPVKTRPKKVSLYNLDYDYGYDYDYDYYPSGYGFR